MRYWDDMNDKYAFGDGCSVPPDAELCRSVYVQALNIVAARLKSNVRCIAYNRPGSHNPVLIVMVTLAQYKKIPHPHVISGDFDLDSLPNEKEPNDEAWEATVAECNEMGLDDYVISEPVLSPEFLPFLIRLRAGTYVILTDEHIDAVNEALGRDDVEADEIRNALDEYKDYKDVKAIKKLLTRKENEFKGKGGRGVELADEIDKLRMVLAVRANK